MFNKLTQQVKQLSLPEEEVDLFGLYSRKKPKTELFSFFLFFLRNSTQMRVLSIVFIGCKITTPEISTTWPGPYNPNSPR